MPGGVRPLPLPGRCRVPPRAVLAACLWLAPVGLAHAETILSARFTGPTDRYPHGVLGDDVEWGGMELDVGDSRGTGPGPAAAGKTTRLEIRLPPDRVFEDIAPRLADVNGDGTAEAIVVETQVATGAQLAVYDARGRKIAATPHIGTRFRWLAPAAIADLNGDGATDIAYVETPHLGKTLRVWSWAPGGLREIARLTGVTNHRIGDAVIRGGLRDCGQGPEIVLADAGFRSLVAVAFEGATLAARPLGIEAGPHGFERAMTCR